MTTGVKRFCYAEVLFRSAFPASGIHLIELPDERITTVGVKRFRYAEVLFRSKFSASGIHVVELPDERIMTVGVKSFRYAGKSCSSPSFQPAEFTSLSFQTDASSLFAPNSVAVLFFYSVSPGPPWLNEGVLSGLVKDMLTHSVVKVQRGSRHSRQYPKPRPGHGTAGSTGSRAPGILPHWEATTTIGCRAQNGYCARSGH